MLDTLDTLFWNFLVVFSFLEGFWKSHFLCAVTFFFSLECRTWNRHVVHFLLVCRGVLLVFLRTDAIAVC